MKFLGIYLTKHVKTYTMKVIKHPYEKLKTYISVKVYHVYWFENSLLRYLFSPSLHKDLT